MYHTRLRGKCQDACRTGGILCTIGRQSENLPHATALSFVHNANTGYCHRNVVPAVPGKIRHRAVQAPGTAPPARNRQGIAAVLQAPAIPISLGSYFLCAYSICLRALVFHPGISSVRYPHQNGVSNHGLHDADADYHSRSGIQRQFAQQEKHRNRDNQQQKGD